MDPDLVSETLSALSDPDTARKRRKHLKPFRGLRGTPARGVTEVLVAVWKRDQPELPRDSDALHHIFCTAHEDGMVAIGLAAARVPDSPNEVLDLVDRWLGMADDHETADALGWLLWGPGLLAAGEPVAETLDQVSKNPRPWTRRAAVMALMALLPVPITGQPAGALRERLGRHVQIVETPQTASLARVCMAFGRDQDPHVRKALIRVLKTWAELEPEPVQTLIDSVRGGVPKQLREQVEKSVRKGRREQG